MSFVLFLVSRPLKSVVVCNSALKVLEKSIKVIVIGMICNDDPDMYDMNAFMGICLPGPMAMSHAF